jgi:hypothetical protein
MLRCYIRASAGASKTSLCIAALVLFGVWLADWLALSFLSSIIHSFSSSPVDILEKQEFRKRGLESQKRTKQVGQDR